MQFETAGQPTRRAPGEDSESSARSGRYTVQNDMLRFVRALNPADQRIHLLYAHIATTHVPESRSFSASRKIGLIASTI